MEASILNSVKKILGIGESYTVYDLDLIEHINSTFSVLQQIGVGPEEGFMIEGKDELWASFDVPSVQLNLVKTYVVLKVRMLFDPPTTSFLIESTNKQIEQYEWRLNLFREAVAHPYVAPEVTSDY